MVCRCIKHIILITSVRYDPYLVFLYFSVVEVFFEEVEFVVVTSLQSDRGVDEVFLIS